jgi:hypothetical protein
MHPGKPVLLIIGALILTALIGPWSATAADLDTGKSDGKFQDLRSKTEAYISYYRGIALTPEELQVRNEALSSIPAPCCDEFSAATCCCVCNLARSIWGLSNYLIHEEKLSAEEVRGAVVDWLAFTNPDGYSGNACFNGGCGRPFYRDGCGGMEEGKLVI